MYVRSPLSLRNVEDLLFERGVDVCISNPKAAPLIPGSDAAGNNPNSFSLEVSNAITLPADLVVGSTPGTNNCGGTLDGVAESGSMTISTTMTGASCAYSFNVTSSWAGTYMVPFGAPVVTNVTAGAGRYDSDAPYASEHDRRTGFGDWIAPCRNRMQLPLRGQDLERSNRRGGIANRRTGRAGFNLHGGIAHGDSNKPKWADELAASPARCNR